MFEEREQHTSCNVFATAAPARIGVAEVENGLGWPVVNVERSVSSRSIVDRLLSREPRKRITVDINDSWVVVDYVRRVWRRWSWVDSAVHFDEHDLIPDEIWLCVFQLLPSYADVDSMRLVSTRFARLGADRRIKRQTLLRKVPFTLIEPLDVYATVAAIAIGYKRIGKSAFVQRFVSNIRASKVGAVGSGTRYYALGDVGHVGVSLFDLPHWWRDGYVTHMTTPVDLVCLCFSYQMPSSLTVCRDVLQRAYLEIGPLRVACGHRARAPFVLVGLCNGKTRLVSDDDVAAMRDLLARTFGVLGIVVDATSATAVDETFARAVALVARASTPVLRERLRPFTR